MKNNGYIFALMFAVLFTIGALPKLQLQEEEIAQLETEKNELTISVSEKDILIENLNNFNLSELSIEKQFQVAADIYETDWLLIYSIAVHETGNFESKLFLDNHNPGGIKANGGWAKYDNSFQGILEMTRLIKKSYIDKGYDTLEKMEPKYCPDGSSWAKKVNKIMSDLKNNEKAQ